MLTGEKGKRQNDEKNTIFHDLSVLNVLYPAGNYS